MVAVIVNERDEEVLAVAEEDHVAENDEDGAKDDEWE
jgi:hypothetical protein